jgi:ABC-type Na+ efflux pump permease subunit
LISIARFTILKVFEPAFVFLITFGFLICYITGGSQTLDLSFFSTLTQAGEAGNLDIGTFILVMLSCIIAVFVGSTEIPRDLNTRMITILLSKPISRSKYVMGRFLGTWMLSSILFCAWLIALGCIQYYNMPDKFNLNNFLLNFIYIFSLAPISAISVAVSTYLDDVPAMIVSFMIIAMAFTMGSIPIIIRAFPNASDIGKMLLLFYYILPNFTYLFRNFDAFYQVLAFLVYTLSMSTIVLKIGIIHFNERDLV